MLSIGKIGASPEQQNYYEEQVAKSREDYYQGTGEAPGEWFGGGGGAELLGLSGQANAEQLHNLFAGKHPETGEQLRRMWKPGGRGEDENTIELDTMAEVDDARAAGLQAQLRGAGHQTVHGLDLTFSAPKSVSTLFAIGDADIQQRAIEAHEWAVNEALRYMEQQAARVVRGHKATRQELEKDPGADTLTTHEAKGFVAIKYRHRMNRLQDPHLHTHVVVGNYAQGPDGRWTALAAQHIYEHAKAGGHVYQTILRAKMRELFPWVQWGEVENGMAELSPELMHPELLKHFSQRSQDIEAYVREYMHAAAPGESSRGVRQYAWRKTRGPKPAPMSAVEEQDWRADIAARAAEFGLTLDGIRVLERTRQFHNTEDVALASIAEHAFGPDGVTALNNTFETKDMMIEVAGSWQQGHGTTLEALYTDVEILMRDSHVVEVEVDKKNLRQTFTTEELRAREAAFLDMALHGKAEGRAKVDIETIQAAIRAHAAELFALDDEQQDVMRGVLRDGNVISSVEALAGSGKTTTANAMRMAYEAAGYTAVAAGPTGRAVRELGEKGHFNAPRTLSWWELRLQSPRGPRAVLEYELGDLEKTVLFIDEAGMADTRLLSNVVTTFAENGVKVVLIGDSQQLPSVRAGGILRGLTAKLGSYALTEVRRQRNKEEIKHLAQIRRGKPRGYVEFKQQTEWTVGIGPVDVGEEPQSTTRTVTCRALTEHDAYQQIERDLHHRGLDEAETVTNVTPTDRGIFTERPDLEVYAGPQAEEEAMGTAIEDYLRKRGELLAAQLAHPAGELADAAPGVESIALITKNNTWRAQLNQMIRQELTLSGDLTGHTMFGSRNSQELEWALGDRVIARRNDRGYDLDNGSRGTITYLDAERMTITDDLGGIRDFIASNPDDLRYVSEHLDHAYALTGHGTQGATLEWSGVLGLPGDFSREWAYTALTRAKDLAHIYLVGGYTLEEQKRKDFATVAEPEADHRKLVQKMTERMTKRDGEDLAVLKIEARDARLQGAVDERLEATLSREAIDAYQEQIIELAAIPYQRMRTETPDHGVKVDQYAELRLELDLTRAEMTSETLQDAIAAAHQWSDLQAMINRARPEGVTDEQLEDTTKLNIDVWEHQQALILATYPNPQTILHAEQENTARTAYLEKKMRVARESAITEHLQSAPDWVLNGVGKRPTVKALRPVYDHVVTELAGAYIDEITDPSYTLGADALHAPTIASSESAADRVATTAAALKEARDAWRVNDDLESFNTLMQARKDWAAAVLDTNPQWVQSTLGPRPAEGQMADRWQELGEKLAGLRKSRGITNDPDNGVIPQADDGLLRAISKFRVDIGLDEQNTIEQEHGPSFGR